MKPSNFLPSLVALRMTLGMTLGMILGIALGLSPLPAHAEAAPTPFQPYMIIVQPIVVQGDDGTAPASMALPEDLVDRAYARTGIDFYFLPPLRYNNSQARDGKINLDEIVVRARADGMLRGQGDIVNMFFVNAVDGKKGPLGRGLFNGDITFIALGDNTPGSDEAPGTDEDLQALQAFVIAHEVGHNLGLGHVVDDPDVPDAPPNLQGDGPYRDRIDPQHSLTDHQISRIRQSPLVHPRIAPLPLEKARRAILDESFEPYFAKLEKREIETFVQKKAPEAPLDQIRDFARDQFSAAVLPFSEQEQKALTGITREVRQILLDNDLPLMAEHPWRFIKVDSRLCGGFAHTRGTSIILSQRHLDDLLGRWREDMDPASRSALLHSVGALLVHEQMHSLQRAFPEKFLRLNTTYWTFKKARVEPEQSITLNQVSNPDAPQAEWLIPDERRTDSYYWIRTLLRPGVELPQMGKDFTDRVFTVRQQDGRYRVAKDDDGTPVSFPVRDFTSYLNSFPVTRGIDHPNEIAAYMFADYFRALVADRTPVWTDLPPRARENSQSFRRWIRCEMSRDGCPDQLADPAK